jgi:hypothetical protein
MSKTNLNFQTVHENILTQTNDLINQNQLVPLSDVRQEDVIRSFLYGGSKSSKNKVPKIKTEIKNGEIVIRIPLTELSKVQSKKQNVGKKLKKTTKPKKKQTKKSSTKK